MALPASGELGGNTTTQAQFKTKIEDLRDYVATRANESGDANKVFKVADAVNADESANKGQLDKVGAIKLDAKYDENGESIIKNDDTFIKNQCTAWVVFDGETGTIKDSYNISSMVRNAEGDYTFTFTIAMKNTNYYGTGCGKRPSGDSYHDLYFIGDKDKDITTTEVSLRSRSSVNNAARDGDHCIVTVFGGK